MYIHLYSCIFIYIHVYSYIQQRDGSHIEIGKEDLQAIFKIFKSPNKSVPSFPNKVA